jgi:hypothetical protein
MLQKVRLNECRHDFFLSKLVMLMAFMGRDLECLSRQVSKDSIDACRPMSSAS